MGTDAVNRSLWRTLKLSDKSEEKKSVGTTKPRTEKWVSSLWDKTATGFTEGGAGKHSVVCGCLLSLARGELPQPGRVPARRKRSTWGLSFVQLWAKSGKKLHCCKDRSASIPEFSTQRMVFSSHNYGVLFWVWMIMEWYFQNFPRKIMDLEWFRATFSIFQHGPASLFQLLPA